MLTAVRPASLSRRRVILGGACLPVLMATACTGEMEEPPPDPDRVALEAARDVELDLADVMAGLRNDGGTDDELDVAAVTMVVGVVEAHATALETALTDVATSVTPSGSSTATTAGEAARVADRAADAHLRAVRAASAAITPLLASIAASDAAVAAYLRGAAR
jgi:hypothetical protein